MKDKLEFFIATLDMHLACDKSPQEALAATVEDYAFVYHGDKHRSTLSKASERALKVLLEEPIDLMKDSC